jgi:hypothetical protein
MDEKTVARFWAKVNRNGRTVRPELGPCWEWTAGKFSNGYGAFAESHKKQRKAHRVSYALAVGDIPPGALVCHRCDNPSCVRPEHLFAGSDRDNVIDCVQKHRRGVWTKPESRPRGDRSGARLHPERMRRYGDQNGARRHPESRARGENNGSSKLTSEQVRELRRMYAAGGVSKNALARAFGISWPVVNGIILRTQWKHVE